MNKKKVLFAALAVCLVAIISMGSLAWFTAQDSVTNNFYVAGSDDNDPNEVFSVDVWEDDDAEDPDGEAKIQDGIKYPNIQPGDDLYKEVHVENTGAYDQYIRATVTVTGAYIWQDVYGEYIVPLNVLTNAKLDDVHTLVSYYDATIDAFVYELYYATPLEVGTDIIVFDTVNISENLDRYQAAALSEFHISVVADAVQTENVGANVYEAFQTVGLVTDKPVSDPAAVLDALADESVERVVLDPTVDWSTSPIAVTADVSDKTIDFNGQNGTISFAGLTENVTIVNLKEDADNAGTTPNVDVSGALEGSSVTVKDSTLVSSNGTSGSAIKVGSNCDLTIDDCAFASAAGKNYAVYGFSGGNITVTDTTFDGFEGTWAMLINGTIDGDVVIDNCAFTDCAEGIFKGSVAGGGHNGLLNGDFTFTNNTLTDCAGHDNSEAKMFDAKVTGTITVSGNTRDDAEWTPGADNGIVQK